MLGKLTGELIACCCPASQQREISELLSRQCSNHLPGVGDSPEWGELIDRVQLAAIRGSAWDIEKVGKAVSLANIDWRDVLVGAGFGSSLSAHKAWQQRAIQSNDVS